MFLSYRGVETVLTYMRPSNKALCSHAVDVYLQLAVESGNSISLLVFDRAYVLSAHTIDLYHYGGRR